MNSYSRKKRWKWILFSFAVVIVTASLWYTNIIVKKIAESERQNVKIWANALQRKANLVAYTDSFFEEIREEERKRAEILADASKNMMKEVNSDVIDIYYKIIRGNTTIPVIMTKQNDSIIHARNVPDSVSRYDVLKGDLKKEFTVYKPIRIEYLPGEVQMLYFKESLIYTELRQVLNDLNESFLSEVVENAVSVPVIITDSTKQHVLLSGNLGEGNSTDSVFLAKTLAEMASENRPIEITLSGPEKRYIFYKSSAIQTQLTIYPYVQFGVIGLFLLITYFLFSTSRRSEQDRVWVGMSKETAHQLGTPLSSMMAWLELMKLKGIEDEGLTEIRKDIDRLENITDRFSKIGSPPSLDPVNVVDVVYSSTEYIKSRTSKKVEYNIRVPGNRPIIVPLNAHLFSWVIENLVKNAIDAMAGNGKISISVEEEKNHVVIDVSDTGKGIHKSHFKAIFNPGYTSKKRGWGLGLSLSKRIIRDYHKGKIFVKHSYPGRDTTFRIILKK
ncbi:MAG: HAMP domain-containing sensor histidine kinase [Bacteroidales bacterium]|nr:HAMP domain-containing sensor histidine kinase [Bacteroidales bacterium]